MIYRFFIKFLPLTSDTDVIKFSLHVIDVSHKTNTIDCASVFQCLIFKIKKPTYKLCYVRLHVWSSNISESNVSCISLDLDMSHYVNHLQIYILCQYLFIEQTFKSICWHMQWLIPFWIQSAKKSQKINTRLLRCFS